MNILNDMQHTVAIVDLKKQKNIYLHVPASDLC